MVGPITGPTLGGYLTEMYNWRYVFYVNLPFGVLAITGLMIFLPKAAPRSEMKFDWTGFAVLALGIGALQLMLDRGQDQDWFSSREILIEAVLGTLGLYLFVVHMFTGDRPFLPPDLFKDRNFISGVTMVFFTATVMLASSALMAPYLESLAGYPVATAGLAMAPRGIGTMIGMQIASRVSQYVDARKVMAIGLISLGSALYTMSLWTPDVPTAVMSVTFMVQGFSIGLVFNPMTVMAFTTLPPHLRGYATSLQALARNIGQAVGVSVTSFTLTRGVQTAHADIAGGLTPFDRALQGNTPAAHILDPTTQHGAAILDQMVNHQAQIIAFNSDFRMMTLVVLPPLLLLLVMRRHVRPAAKPVVGDD